MKHISNFKGFINEAKIEKINKNNTFYWDDTDGKLVYQIPYIFAGQSENVDSAEGIEGASRRKIKDIVLAANNKINKEYEKAQEAILKIGEDAAKEVNKIIANEKK